MTKDELLRPRYRVIADYPGSEFEIGQIIEFTHKSTFFTGEPEWATEMVKNKYGHNQFCIKKIECGIPHLFQPIPWWQDRKPEEMPKYVRYDNKVSRIVGIEYDANNNKMCQIEWNGKGLFHLDNQYQLKGFSFREVEPATEEEYILYNQNK